MHAKKVSYRKTSRVSSTKLYVCVFNLFWGTGKEQYCVCKYPVIPISALPLRYHVINDTV